MDQESVAAEADRLVDGDRQDTYGHPLDDMTRTGRLIAPILEATWTPGEPVPPEVVALIMNQVKVSRECNAPKRDNRTDGCGYWKCVDMIHDERGRRARAELTVQAQEWGMYTMPIDRCPTCGGPADNGHDRCYPPNPYLCTKCESPRDQQCENP